MVLPFLFSPEKFRQFHPIRFQPQINISYWSVTIIDRWSFISEGAKGCADWLVTGFAGNFLPFLLTWKHTLKNGEINVHACAPVLVSIDRKCAAFRCIVTRLLCVLLFWRECVLVEGHLKVYCARMLKSAENRKRVSLPFVAAFAAHFPSITAETHAGKRP